MLGEIAPKIHGNLNTGNFQFIQKITIGTAINSVIFSNIPQNFNHLKIIGMARASDAANSITIFGRFNGDSGSNYITQYFVNNTNATSIGGASAQTSLYVFQAVAASGTANYACYFESSIPFYNNTLFYKALSTPGIAAAVTASYIGMQGGTWANTAAINSITLIDGSGGNFLVGSQFILYGIY